MNYQYLTVRTRDRVGWIEYNRPPINAFNREMLNEVPAALENLLKDPKVRVIVFSSAIEKYFSTGVEIRVFDRISIKGVEEWISACHALVSRMRQAGKPLLAAVRGIAAGAGFEIILHCDIRFASADARFGLPEINIGFIPSLGATQALAEILGRSRALRFLYEGNLVSAEEARAMGLVDFVCSLERTHEEVHPLKVRSSKKTPLP